MVYTHLYTFQACSHLSMHLSNFVLVFEVRAGMAYQLAPYVYSFYPTTPVRKFIIQVLRENE